MFRFERYSQEGRTAVTFAADEARAFKAREVGTEHLLLGAVRVQPEVLDVGAQRLRNAIADARESVRAESPPLIPFSGPAARVMRTTIFVMAGALEDGVGIGPAHLVAGVLWNDAWLNGLLRTLGLDPDVARKRASALATSAPATRIPRQLSLSETMNRHICSAPVTEDRLTFTCLRCGLKVPATDAQLTEHAGAIVYSCPRDGAEFVSVAMDGYSFMSGSLTVRSGEAEVDWWDFTTSGRP